MRIAFPVPAPPTAPAAAPQLHVKPVIPLDAVRVAIGRPYRDDVEEGKKKAQGEASEASVGYAEENEWMLGRSVLLEEAVTEDIVLLMHHLVGPSLYSVSRLTPIRVRGIPATIRKPLGSF